MKWAKTSFWLAVSYVILSLITTAIIFIPFIAESRIMTNGFITVYGILGLQMLTGLMAILSIVLAIIALIKNDHQKKSAIAALIIVIGFWALYHISLIIYFAWSLSKS